MDSTVGTYSRLKVGSGVMGWIRTRARRLVVVEGIVGKGGEEGCLSGDKRYESGSEPEGYWWGEGVGGWWW